jgi:hypothetical protein
MNFSINLTCPHCYQSCDYDIEIDNLRTGIGTTNEGAHVYECPLCSNAFVGNIHYQFQIGGITRKIIPGNFALVDNGEFDIDENGCVIEVHRDNSFAPCSLQQNEKCACARKECICDKGCETPSTENAKTTSSEASEEEDLPL